MAETFDLSPEFPMGVSVKRRVIQTPAEQGFVQRKDLWGFNLRIFTLRWDNLTEAGARRLLVLWEAAEGPVLKMNFTPPGEAATSVRFVGSTLALRRKSAVSYSADVILEEVR